LTKISSYIMCFNYETSITIWLVSLFVSSYMLLNTDQYDNWIPIFILTYTQIQIMEAILWSSLNNKTINHKTTKLLSFLLLCQPLVHCIIAYYKTKNQAMLYAIAIFSIVLLYHFFSTMHDQFQSTVGPHGHLIWNRYDEQGNSKNLLGKGVTILYLIGLLVPLFLMNNMTMKIATIFFITGSLLFSSQYGAELGSLWCYIAALYPIIVLILGRIH